MDILLYKDLLIGFISREIKKDYLKQIKLILDNDNSVFLYSKKFIQFIRQEIREEDEQLFLDLFRKVFDNHQSFKNLDDSPNTFDEEFISINSQSQNNVTFRIAHNPPSDVLEKKAPNFAVLSKQNKPNFHWLITELAISHPRKVTLNCFDFTSNLEITEFFNNVYNLPKRLNIVHIFDTQCNFIHDKFNFLKTAKSRVFYYTKFSSHEKNQFDRKDDIKDNFGPSSKAFLTLPHKKAHGRRIIFENIIITCDQDFWNLEINSSDWCIDVQYSKQDTTNWLQRRSNYKEFK